MLHHDVWRRPTTPRSLDVIRQVRKRWRMKLALRGGVGFLGATALVASARLRPRGAAVQPGLHPRLPHRVIVAALAFAAWFLVRPLMRRVSDEQVALYLEEHEPTLEATIITAMEAERSGARTTMSPRSCGADRSRGRARHEIEEGRRVERVPVRRYATAAASWPSPRSRCSRSVPPTCVMRCRHCS